MVPSVLPIAGVDELGRTVQDEAASASSLGLVAGWLIILITAGAPR